MLRSLSRAFASFVGMVSPTIGNTEAFSAHPCNRSGATNCKEPHGAVARGHEGAGHQCLTAERAAVQYVRTGMRPTDKALDDQAFRVRYMRAVFALSSGELA